MEPSRRIERLIEIMAALRDPVTGCPWDQAQTFETVAPHTLEEAYEVIDAIERGDMADLKDELGDLLLQVAYHARIAEEAGAFAFDDVVESITGKMIRRHPHVFAGADHVEGEAVNGAWERIKANERDSRGSHLSAASGTLDHVANALPALTRAAKLQRRASTVGFDWTNGIEVLEKIREETRELEAEMTADPPDQAGLEDELGDLLFTIVNLARHLELDPERSLRRAGIKFEQRFRALEKSVVDSGRTMKAVAAAELEEGWDTIKAAERGPASE